MISAAGLLLAGCSLGKGKPADVGKPSANDGEGVEIEDKVSKLSKQFGVTLLDGAKKAALDPIDGSASSGLATLSGENGAQTITIIANLPDLEKKETYAARLVGGEKSIALGALTIAKGGWMLEQKVNIDPTVSKTIEVLKGAQVILRGSF